MAPVYVPTLKKPSFWCPFTRLLDKYVVPFVDLKFIEIGYIELLKQPYKVLPVIKKIFTRPSFLSFFYFHRTLFMGLRDPWCESRNIRIFETLI